jgi:hypothetical protein
MATTVYLRDKEFNLVGEVSHYDQFEATVGFNVLGRFVLNYSYDERHLTSDAAALIDAMQPGGGVVVKREGAVIFSGPILRRRESWAAGKRALEISGTDDNWVISTRLCLPVVDGSPFSSASHDVRVGAAETIMVGYVDYNMGPSAMSARQVAGLTIGADLGRGGIVTARARFCSLLEMLQAIALAGGGLGFKMAQTTGAGVNPALTFTVYEQDDKTSTVRFGTELGNLSSWGLLEDVPSGNVVYVGGQGELTARAFVERLDQQSMMDYGRIEFFKDQRNEANAAQLAVWGDAELQAAGAGITIEAKAVETDYPVWGVDYDLGDIVTVIVDGMRYTETIRSVTIKMTQQTVSVQPIIGSVTAKTSGLGFSARLDEIDKKITNLETE